MHMIALGILTLHLHSANISMHVQICVYIYILFYFIFLNKDSSVQLRHSGLTHFTAESCQVLLVNLPAFVFGQIREKTVNWLRDISLAICQT